MPLPVRRLCNWDVIYVTVEALSCWDLNAVSWEFARFWSLRAWHHWLWCAGTPITGKIKTFSTHELDNINRHWNSETDILKDNISTYWTIWDLLQAQWTQRDVMSSKLRSLYQCFMNNIMQCVHFAESMDIEDFEVSGASRHDLIWSKSLPLTGIASGGLCQASNPGQVQCERICEVIGVPWPSGVLVIIHWYSVNWLSCL